MRRPSRPLPYAVVLRCRTAALHIPVKALPPHLHLGSARSSLAAHGTHKHAPLTWLTGIPRIVVFDNAGIHRSRTMRQARRALAEQGIWLWYPPAYRPELNDIERTFRTVKHGAMPQRTFTTTKALTTAVEDAFEQINAQLQPSE